MKDSLVCLATVVYLEFFRHSTTDATVTTNTTSPLDTEGDHIKKDIKRTIKNDTEAGGATANSRMFFNNTNIPKVKFGPTNYKYDIQPTTTWSALIKLSAV